MPYPRPRALPSCLATIAAAALQTLGLPQAHAQQPSPPATTAGSPATQKVPALPLEEALAHLARQADLQLLADHTLIRGRSAPAISAQPTLSAALETLLAGTGLRGRIEGRTLVVEPALRPAPEETVMPVIKARARADIARSGTAAEGYRATHSAVAGFSERPLKDTPFSVKVLPAELLLNHGANDIGELDRFDASVSNAATTTGWFSAPSVRGFNLHNWSNYRYNGQTIVNQVAMGLENKERVEVLKGLSALQGGFSAPGGLVNYVTKRPRDIAAVHLHANEHGHARLHADLGRSFDDRFGLRVNVAVEDERSHVDHVDGARRFASLAADWRITPRTTLAVDLEHERRNQHATPSFSLDSSGRLPDVDPQVFLGQDWSRYPSDTTTLSARLEHGITERWSIAAAFNHARQERSQNGLSLLDIQPDGRADVYLYHSPDQAREPLNADLRVNGRFATGGIGHDLSVGLAHSRLSARWGDGFWGRIGSTDLRHPVAIAQPAVSVGGSYPAVRWRENGVFAHDVLSFGPDWDLHLGGRHARIDRRSFRADGTAYGHYRQSRFSPSLALVHRPSAAVSVYASAIEGLEQGGTAPLRTTNANEVMAPLVSRQVEAGAKGAFGMLNWEASLFHIAKAGEYTRANPDGSATYVQNGRQVHRGVELSLAGKPVRELTLFASAMWLRARLERTGNAATEGHRPAGVPALRLAWTAEYAPQGLSGWTFIAHGTHTGRRAVTAANTVDAPGYGILGLGVRHERTVGGREVALRLGIDNLADRRHWANVGHDHLVPGAPRTAWASVSVGF